VLLIAALSYSCDRVSDFDLAPGESYCGNITLAAAYRAGLSVSTQMRMTFDSSKLDAGEPPGTLTTFDAGDESKNQLLADAPLRAIPALEHDPLSQLEFGDGREKNFMFAVSPVAPDAEAIIAVVSLRTDETVEVRLIRAGVATDPPPAGREPLFGLFTLERQQSSCGF
jgi:hypothetical protein